MKSFYLLLLLFIGLVIFPGVSLATTISPTVLDINLDPGKSSAFEIKLYNETDRTLVLDGSIEKFTPKGENGQVNLLPFEVSDPAVNWLQLPINSIVLNPGEGISVPVIVDIPTTADVGGYYLAVMWQSASGPKIDSSQALIVSRVGTLLLLNVTGSAKAQLEITNFNLTDKSNIYSSLPINFSTRVKNAGTVHIRPEGHIFIKDWLGRTSEVVNFNEGSSAILPNSNRIFNSSWANNSSQSIFSVLYNQVTDFKIGKFSAKAVVDYEDKDLTSSEVYFWIIPWQLLSVIFVFILFILFVIKRKKVKITK